MEKIVRLQPILEILRSSPQRLNKILVAQEASRHRFHQLLQLARQADIPVVFVPTARLYSLSRHHQGVVALVSAKEFVSLESVLASAPRSFLVFLDGIEDPQNLGAIIRSAEAAGVDSLILPERHAVGLTAAVYQASAGALEHMRVARVKNIARGLEEVKQHGFWVVGAEAGCEKYWFEFDYKQPVALVFGSEGRGLRQLVRKHCDCLLSIPLMGKTNSLNVAAAASIFFFEVIRQRLFSQAPSKTTV